MKKIVMTMLVLVGMVLYSDVVTAKAMELEILSSDGIIEFNGYIDMLEEDVDSETVEIECEKGDKCVNFYKVVKTGITPERIKEIYVMATPLDGGEVMNILPKTDYEVRSDGKVVFRIGRTVNMEFKESYRGPFKVYIEHR